MIEIFKDVPGVYAFMTTVEEGQMKDEAKIRGLLDNMGLEEASYVFPIQTHTNNVELIRELPRERSQDVDGSITALRNTALITCHADCTPLFFYDPVKQVVAMIHSGWKGTATEIGRIASLNMQSEFACRAEDILVHIGPSIGKCCFEVEEDVFVQFKDPEYTSRINDEGTVKYNIDLKAYNRDMLIRTGIPEGNISISSECTCCDSNKFFSYRRNGTDKRMIAGIILTNER